MSRLVDADKLMKLIPIEEYNARMAIAYAPTVDAVEVKHGHWVKSEDADDGYCSVCKCDMPMYREDWEWKYSETPYCPNCGAKMD